MGDGFMIAFGTARQGLRCAIGMQEAINDLSESPIRIRVGLHTDQVIQEADDFFGTHVNLAARIAGTAQGGQILVSGCSRR